MNNRKKIIPKTYDNVYDKDDGVVFVKNVKGKDIEVFYDKDGNPDFRPFIYQGNDGLNEVQIKLTGDTTTDINIAYKVAGFSKRKNDYTWHHLPDMNTLILVNREIHASFRHTGGNTMYKEFLNKNKK